MSYHWISSVRLQTKAFVGILWLLLESFLQGAWTKFFSVRDRSYSSPGDGSGWFKGPITVDEARQALKMVRTDKTPGIDELPSEMYLKLSQMFFPLLATIYNNWMRGARGVMVIVVENEHGDTSSNPGRDALHFT